MIELMIFISFIIIIGIALTKISHKLGIPILFLFILLGMVFGTDGLFHIEYDNFYITEMLCSFALIFIIFYGGFGTNWNIAKKVSKQSILLASLGTITTAILTGITVHILLDISLIEGMLLGSILSSTDAASVFSILKSNNLALKENTDSLLEIESGSNDPFAYMLTIVFLSILTTNIDSEFIIILIIKQLLIALISSVVISLLSKLIIDKYNIGENGNSDALFFSIAILSFAIPQVLGGNGYLSTYIVGIVLGNHNFEGKQRLFSFFDGMTTIMQIIIFFLLGLLAYPIHFIKYFIPSLILMIIMTFVIRPIVVFIYLSFFKGSINQKLIVSWAGIRGAASIVFAIMAISAGIDMDNKLFAIVFNVVLLSLAIQGGLLPFIAKLTKMYHKEGNVFKTFHDYSENRNIEFIESKISLNSEFIGKKLSEINLLEDMRIVMIENNNKIELATGNSIIEEGDTLIISATNHIDNNKISIKEKKINEDHEWIYKYIKDIKFNNNSRILLILRKDKTIIPTGQTQIILDDIIVVGKIRDAN